MENEHAGRELFACSPLAAAATAIASDRAAAAAAEHAGKDAALGGRAGSPLSRLASETTPRAQWFPRMADIVRINHVMLVHGVRACVTLSRQWRACSSSRWSPLT